MVDDRLTIERRVSVWWAVGAFAFLLRLAAALASGRLRHPELYEYDEMARAFLDGRGFTIHHIGVVYYSYAAPLYSWLSATAYGLTGSIVPVMLLQIAAGAAVAVAAAAIATRLFGGWIAGAAAGLLAACHPGLVLYSATKAHPLVFDALFFTLALLQLFRLAGRPTLWRAVELGAIVGVGTLSRATLIIFLPIGAVWLLAVTPRAGWPTVVRNMIVAGLLTAASLAPWTIRNILLHHQFVFVLTTDGEDFWRGNNPYAMGHSYIDTEHTVLEALPAAERADLKAQPGELGQSRWFMSRAKAFIYSNPSAFVRLTWLKFFHFWWYAPQTGGLYAKAWFTLYMAYYLGAVLLAAIGTWAVVQRGGMPARQVVLIGTFLLALSGLQSLYYVEGRHRWAVEPMLLAISGGGLATLLERRGRAWT